MDEDSRLPTVDDIGFGHCHRLAGSLVDRLATVIRGKEAFLRRLVGCLLAGGHVLLEDVPGLGKTTVAKTLAHLIGDDANGGSVTFRRIQFTPDLLPYDITGVDIYEPESRGFVFSPGPIFANVVLADEINRTTPKVQSALLEVMAENQVTIGNKTHHLDRFFFVVATQNPLDIEGTYPLPVAQIDRFLMRLALGYPDRDVEYQIVQEDPSERIMPFVEPVCGKDEILAAREATQRVHCDSRLVRAVVDIVAATREHHAVELGASPRGSLMLVKAARAYALVHGRDFVIDQDVIDLAPPVLAHRIVVKEGRYTPQELVQEITFAELEKIRY
jgi:MoxR-like ATPase